MLTTDGTPPINLPTASVRAQTANLAALALQRTYSDSAFKRVDSRSTPPIAESYDPAIPEERSSFVTYVPRISRSPHLVLDDLVPSTSPSSHRQSMLTHLLRTSPPEILEPRPSESGPEHPRETLHPNNRLHLDSPHLIAASPSPMSENSALLPGKGDRFSYGAADTYFHDDDDDDGHEFLHEQDLERQGHSGLWAKKPWLQGPQRRIRSCIKNCDRHTLWAKGVVDPVQRIPAVLLGLLLNILDALSYGMILFPLGQPIFEKLGPDGISMFYVSCIISQLVYSLGGSVFKGGIGSEMVLNLVFILTEDRSGSFLPYDGICYYARSR
jgi:sulfate permease, SulP family